MYGRFFYLVFSLSCRFFFPANILSHMDELDEPIENQEEFTAIIMVLRISIPTIYVILIGIWAFLFTIRSHHL